MNLLRTCFALAQLASVVSLFVVAQSLPASSASFSIMAACEDARDRACSATVRMSGTIEIGDERKLQQTLAAADLRPSGGPRRRVLVSLNSLGGEVTAALAIGRILRREQAWTVVFEGDRCASACVLVLGAGVDRLVAGQVIVHRPYFGSMAPGQSAAQVQQRYRDMRRRIEDYAEEMNLPHTLIDLMFSVPPEDGRTLTPEQAARFMLHGVDPVFDEQEIAYLAHAWQLTSAEYRHRQVQIEQVCAFPSMGNRGLDMDTRQRARFDTEVREYDACRVAILASVPLPLARRQVEQARVANPHGLPMLTDDLAELNPSRVQARRPAAGVTR
jgi:hypothetical protein